MGVEDLLKLNPEKQTEYLDEAWSATYPRLFDERRLFEDAMAQTRYKKSAGWGHTGDISVFKSDLFEAHHVILGTKKV